MTNGKSYIRLYYSIEAQQGEKKNFKMNPAIILIKIYSNAEDDKAQILSDNQNKSGIYKFQNSINGKHYLGSELRSKICKKKDLWNILILTIYLNIIIWQFVVLCLNMIILIFLLLF